VRTVDYIDAWLSEVGSAPERYPTSSRSWQEAVQQRPPRWRDTLLVTWGDEGGQVLFGDMDALFAEALDVYATRFGVDIRGSDVQAVIETQKAVLPSRDIAERSMDLEHDVPAYFDAVRSLVTIEQLPEPWKPLRDYGPGTLRLEAGRPSLAYNDFSAPFFRLERGSNVHV
jgi:hypothetical protein